MVIVQGNGVCPTGCLINNQGGKRLWGDGCRQYAKTKKFRKQEIVQTGVLVTLRKVQGLMANHRKSLLSGFICKDETREQYKAKKKGNLE